MRSSFDFYYEKSLELEEMIKRLEISNEIAYDEKFHMEIVKTTASLYKDIADSDMSLDKKKMLIDLISAIFEESFEKNR